jgi:hypothetical protein
VQPYNGRAALTRLKVCLGAGAHLFQKIKRGALSLLAQLQGILAATPLQHAEQDAGRKRPATSMQPTLISPRPSRCS